MYNIPTQDFVDFINVYIDLRLHFEFNLTVKNFRHVNLKKNKNKIYI